MSEKLIQIDKTSEGGIISKVKKIFFKTQVWLMAIHAEGDSSYKAVNFFSYFFLSTKGINLIKKFFIALLNSFTGIELDRNASDNYSYNKWYQKQKPSLKQIAEFKIQSDGFSEKPVLYVNLLILEEDVPGDVQKTISSVLAQIYSYWKLIIVIPAGNLKMQSVISEFKEERIKIIYPEKKLNKAELLNCALENNSGQYSVFVRAGGTLAPECLFKMALCLNNETEIVYTDEDEFDKSGNHLNPFFKPDWSPDSFLSSNFIGDFFLIKTSLLIKAKGFDSFFNNGETYDVLLKSTEHTKNIVHLPEILYHRNTELIGYFQQETMKEILENALIRRGESARVEKAFGSNTMFNVIYNPVKESLISIIIPTKNKQDLVKQCIDSIFHLSTYPNFEVILIDNNSDDPAFFELVETYKILYTSRFKYIRNNAAFNFSTLMNEGAAESSGEYLVLLNNDTKVITPDWLEKMLGQAERSSIGVVGVKLLYPNDAIQHAGVTIESKGAKHVFVSEDRYSVVYHNYINTTHNYTASTAACIMVKKSLYNEVDGFDESFRVDYNDIDFCLRVREKGYNNIYLPYVELYHYESISRGNSNSNKKSYEGYLKETEKFKSRWQKYMGKDPYYNQNKY